MFPLFKVYMDWSIGLHDRICICFACCCRANTTAAWFITIFLSCDLCRQYVTLRILSQYHFAMSADEAIKSAKSLCVAKLQNVPLWWFATWGGNMWPAHFQCDQREVCTIPFQVWPPHSKHFLRACYQMDTWDKSKLLGKCPSFLPDKQQPSLQRVKN